MSEPLFTHDPTSLDFNFSSDNRRLSFICSHPLYILSYQRLEELEKERIFCRHQMNHLLDVARIAYILDLKMKLGIGWELIYASALLHDIGKSRQYEEGIPHEMAGAKIAGQILEDMPPDLSFSEVEKRQIITAVKGHRRLREAPEPLEALLYHSDKLSRTCFSCPAESECNWNNKKKNKELRL